jgi:anti-anti-sigma regulatory factor
VAEPEGGLPPLRRLRLPAELTHRTTAAHRDRLLTPLSEGCDIEIDLATVHSIDAAGLQLLLTCQLHALATGRRMRTTGHSAAVRDLLQRLGAADYFA